MKKIIIFVLFVFSFSLSSCFLSKTKDYEFYFDETNNSYLIVSYNGNDTNIEIPSKYKNKPVTEIGSFAFLGCTTIESVKIPDSVNIIGAHAFKECTSLKEIEFGIGITGIYPEAFYGCKSLINIELPEGVTNIGVCAFGGCSSLENISIPDSISYIASAAFVDCSSLKYNIFDNAMYCGNDNNPYVALIKGVSNSIETCVIHEDSKVIAGGALSDTKLTNIIIPKNIKTIVASSLASPSLEHIEILDREFLFIEKEAVLDNKFLEYNEFEGGLYLGNNDNPYLVFMKLKNKENSSILNIHENTKIIACSALEYDSTAEKIKKIYLPENLTCIGESAFRSCYNLREIVIPENVDYIGFGVFGNTKVYCCVEEKKINWYDNIFDDTPPFFEKKCYWKGQWEYDADGNPVPLN